MATWIKYLLTGLAIATAGLLWFLVPSDALIDGAAWLLQFLVSIIGIWVAIKVPEASQRKAWIVGLSITLIGTGAITLYQQHRARAAHASDVANLKLYFRTSLDGKMKQAREEFGAQFKKQTEALTKQNSELSDLIRNIGKAANIQTQNATAHELAAEIIAKLDPVWKMPVDQKNRLAAVLSHVPQKARFKVRLLLLPASQQSHTFGDDLSGVLHQNGFDGERVTDYSLSSDLYGLSVVVPNGTKGIGDIPQKTRELMAILHNARIPFALRPPGTSAQWDSPAIVVGMKPEN